MDNSICPYPASPSEETAASLSSNLLDRNSSPTKDCCDEEHQLPVRTQSEVGSFPDNSRARRKLHEVVSHLTGDNLPTEFQDSEKSRRDGAHMHGSPWANKFPAAPDKSANAEIWRTYVKKADEHDIALIARWNEGVDVFLLFTGLFSAILSAFLIASWSTLQPDSGQATVDGLVAISTQLAALSSGQPIALSDIYQPQQFVVPWWAVTVNALWFTSLIISLIAAVLAMLVKEWLSSYNENVSLIPVERVRQRQFRYDGLIKWRVPSIVSFLPVSIHVAVFLFLAGLAVFAWPVSLFLSVLMGVSVAAASLLYFVSAAAPVFSLDCPYKSPLFTALHALWRTGRHFISSLRKHSETKGTRSMIALESGRVRSASRPHFERPRSAEMAYINATGGDIQAKALAWLAKSPDRSAQEAALYFLSWWRMPARTWVLVRQDIQQAAVSFVQEFLVSARTSARVDLDRKEGENLALISNLLPHRSMDDYWMALRDWANPRSPFHIQVFAPAIRTNFGLDSIGEPGELWRRHAPISSLCTLLEALHTRLSEGNVNPILTALNIMAPYVARSSVHRTFLFKYLSLLAHALLLKDESLECCLVTEEWTARYPSEWTPGTLVNRGYTSALPFDGLLVDCLLQLYSEDTLPDQWRHTAGNPRKSIRRALLTCILENTELLSGPQCQRVIALVVKWILISSTPVEDCEGSKTIVPLLVALFKNVRVVDLAYHCLPDVVVCLQYLTGLPVDPKVYQDAFEENSAGRPGGETTITTDVTDMPEDFVEHGRMTELLALIDETSAPLCLLALAVPFCALRQVAWQRGGRIKRMQSLVDCLISAGWLEYMSKHGLNYLLCQYRQRCEEDSQGWCDMFQTCLMHMLQVRREEVMASGLVQQYYELTQKDVGLLTVNLSRDRRSSFSSDVSL